MNGESFGQRYAKLAKVAVIWIFAVLGWLTWVVAPAMLGGFRWLLYITETTRTMPSPDGSLRVTQEVTRGGLGTVWTTRLLLRDPASGSAATIYKNRDSDFSPPMRWAGSDRLTICLPAGRVDFLANPFAYSSADTLLRRVNVRFVYCAAGARILE